MKAADCIVQWLETLGVEFVFGYQGGMITHLIDSLSKSRKTKYIQCYHEQSAAIAAEGYALESGNLGVAVSTSGPGASNLLTGIADAYFGSVPVLFLTGQVNTYECKGARAVRQRGFQEMDIVSMAKPVTKYAAQVRSAAELERELNQAARAALSGRKGPALVDLPMDIQRAELARFDFTFEWADPRPELQETALKRAEEALARAKRPFVICGNGIFQSKCGKAVNAFLQRTGVPYAVTLPGKGCVDETRGFFTGMIGSYGNRAANILFSQADVVLALGARLDLRQTGNPRSEILNKILFVHVDLDASELFESALQNKINVHGSVEDFIERVSPEAVCVSESWKSHCCAVLRAYSQDREIDRFADVPEPYHAIMAIRQIVTEPALFVADVRQNQMWAAQALRLHAGDSFYTSGGLAPMGFAIPCAVGAAFANPDRPVICITGDGGFHFALQSLMLISQYRLNVTVYVLNNESLGMITQFQSLYFDSNLAGTVKAGGYFVPDLEKIAAAYNMEYRRVTDVSDLRQYVRVRNTICEIKLPELTAVVPKLEYDKELYDMTPRLPETELAYLNLENPGGGYNRNVIFPRSAIFNRAA